jgi:hypothetical protein
LGAGTKAYTTTGYQPALSRNVFVERSFAGSKKLSINPNAD